MSLLDKTLKAMEGKKEIVSEDVPPEQKKNKRTYVRRVSKPDKVVVPEHIKILFDSLDKSINSVWGSRPNKSNKWDAKYTMWVSFKKWFEELSNK